MLRHDVLDGLLDIKWIVLDTDAEWKKFDLWPRFVYYYGEYRPKIVGGRRSKFARGIAWQLAYTMIAHAT